MCSSSAVFLSFSFSFLQSTRLSTKVSEKVLSCVPGTCKKQKKTGMLGRIVLCLASLTAPCVRCASNRFLGWKKFGQNLKSKLLKMAWNTQKCQKQQKWEKQFWGFKKIFFSKNESCSKLLSCLEVMFSASGGASTKGWIDRQTHITAWDHGKAWQKPSLCQTQKPLRPQNQICAMTESARNSQGLWLLRHVTGFCFILARDYIFNRAFGTIPIRLLDCYFYRILTPEEIVIHGTLS